ncbi:S41 family peptidase [Taibaiella lutea]|uniref:S41 family peptidase n=1 Tax=Taibaiella lutea TaxID=2608001 RepID=A0A5M6CTE6_9BACT|nr:S41 family peptidase [Taibaiella lutea]KAA5537232.1 S41 family peptidase [Taibaiella lutea]
MSNHRKAVRTLGWTMATSFCLLHSPLKAQDNDPSDKYFEISKNLEIFSNVFKELNQYYVDPIQPGKMVKTGVDAMLNDLDPYTNLITEADAEDYQLQTTGKYSGIGVSTKVVNGEFVIAELFENGPVAKAGIKAGDIIVAIDGQRIKGKDDEDLAILMRGAPGTMLKMTTRNPLTKKEETKTITREEIQISSVPYANLIGEKNNIAYVFLTQFTPNCSRDVRNALDSLKAANPELKGVILDLRGNPGGLLDEAVKIVNLFNDKGQLVVSTRGKNAEWQKEFKTTGNPWDLNIPMAVLVNHGSASASEIVSGTTQDLDRGVIIGTRSYGKGLVQNVRPLGYNTRLKITTAKYYTPSGRCIQALDYSHRNEDGSVSIVPDSLKKPFKTKGGRTVYDGGGIEPDIKMEDITLSPISLSLLRNNYIFDYVTEYYYKHPSIESAATFTITDADFTDFQKWLENKDYGYKTDGEILMDSLKAVSVKNKTFDNAKNEYNALAAKLYHDKKQDLQNSKKEITFLLSNEIVSRYYFQKGRAINRLKYEDDVLQKALDVLADTKGYNDLLKNK